MRDMRPAFSFLRKVVHQRFGIPCRTYSGVRSNYVYSSRVNIPPQTTAVLAGRDWLPGAKSKGCQFPQYMASPTENLPAVYQCKESSQRSLDDLAKEAREILEDELHIHGAMLFRNLPLPNGATFSKFISGLGYTMMGYEGGSGVRHKVEKDVLTASNDPPEYSIEPHNEMAYFSDQDTVPTEGKYIPCMVFFYCDVPAQPGQGGESVICDNRDVLPKLNPQLVDKVRKVGVKYFRHLPERKSDGYDSWQETFITEDKAVVEKFLKGRRMDYQWEKDGSLSYWYTLPGFVTHPKTGEDVWFNHIHAHHASYFKYHPMWSHLDLPDNRYPFHSYYGDGSELEEETVQHVRNVLWNVAVGCQLQKGDVVAVDNVYVQHARLGFSGERKLLVSLVKK
ncbi:dapdiamide synthesis protein DdaC-like [Glandiceps talaboti]